MSAWKSYFFAGAFAAAVAFTPNLQAAAGSLDLDPVGPIISLDGKVPGDPGFDSAAEAYFNFQSSTIDPFVSTYTDGSGIFSPPMGLQNDKLTVSPEANLRFYIYDEEARFNNVLGFVKNDNFDLTDAGNKNSVILPNTQLDPASDPLLPKRGDYVNMGTFADGDMVDFFLVSEGADLASDEAPDPDRIWWTSNAGLTNGENADGQLHAYLLGPGSDSQYDYYLLAFEDLTLDQNGQIPGNPNEPDFTDIVGVIQVGVPEPSTYAMLGLTLAFVLMWHTRRQKALAQG